MRPPRLPGHSDIWAPTTSALDFQSLVAPTLWDSLLVARGSKTLTTHGWPYALGRNTA